MSNSERHQERRLNRAKQKHRESNMRRFKVRENTNGILHLVPKKTVPEKTWLQRLGARIKALWKGNQSGKHKEAGAEHAEEAAMPPVRSRFSQRGKDTGRGKV